LKVKVYLKPILIKPQGDSQKKKEEQLNILITGGAGYIGSHTILEFFEQGYSKLISADNFINSNPGSYERIKSICGQKPFSVQADLSQPEAAEKLFQAYQFDAVIHFAALKSVPDSVAQPNIYYQNNLNALLNVLDQMKKQGVNRLIFSSSCSIYGNPDKLPVTEQTPFGKAESPYAKSKQMGEEIIQDFIQSQADCYAISLRYFNPVGAHYSGKIGEELNKRPDNLLPIITQAAAGIRPQMTVFGNDYNTKDGSCIRDYIHVSDIARAHLQALEYLKRTLDKPAYQAINLGSGKGTSVLEMISTFEAVTQTKVPYEIGSRRAGDVESIYADNKLAKELLGWEPKYDLKEMLLSAWNWQNNLLTS